MKATCEKQENILYTYIVIYLFAVCLYKDGTL